MRCRYPPRGVFQDGLRSIRSIRSTSVVYQGLDAISETAPVSQSSRVRGRLRFKGTEAIVLEHAAPCRRAPERVVEGKWGGGGRLVARFATYPRGAASLLINDGSGGGPVVWPRSRWESV